MTPEEKEIALQDIARNLEDAAGRVKNQMELALSVLRGLMLCNGGALVAMFTFIGNNSPASQHANRPLLAWAFGLLIAGLVLTLTAYILGYLTQSFFMQTSLNEAGNKQAQIAGHDSSLDEWGPYRVGSKIEVVAICVVAVSLICFGTASGLALIGVLG